VSQLVIVEGVFVEPPYRGQRLGPRLLTTLVETVTGTGRETLIVLRAQPVPWEHLSEIEFRRSRKKVAASYESVGFAHFRDNIYWRHNAFVGTENLEA
jgi:GNAT superfamily N-acetyltransferase